MRPIVAVLACLAVLGVLSPTLAQNPVPRTDTTTQVPIQNEAKADSIRTLIKMTQAGRIARQVFNRVIRMQQKQHPEVPDQWWKQVRQNMDFDEFVSEFIPIYAKHFTHQEINQLLDFYRSPIGKKVIEKMPVIMKESMSIGREWGRKLRKQLIDKLKQDGYIET